MADDDIAALLQDAALVMRNNNDSDEDDDEDTGSFMSPGFVLREIDHHISPTDLVRLSSSSHHSNSSSAKLMTPTTFLDRMLNTVGTEADMGSLLAPNLDQPSAIQEEDDSVKEFESEEEDDNDGSTSESNMLGETGEITTYEDDDMEDAKMEEDLVDIEALMSQSLTDNNNSPTNNNTSTASKNAFELLMSQSVSDILKEQEIATPILQYHSPPDTPIKTNKDSVDELLQEQKSPVDRAFAGLFKAMGGVFLQQNYNRTNHNRAPIDEEVDSDIDAEQDTPVGQKSRDEPHDNGHGNVGSYPPMTNKDQDSANGSSHPSSGTTDVVVKENFYNRPDLLLTSHAAISRESSEDALSFITATENIADQTPRSLYLPPLESVESMDQATPKRSGSFAPGNTNTVQQSEDTALKPAVTTLGTELVVVDGDIGEQVSPMATLSVNQVEQVFRTNEVLVQIQQDLVSLSSASSTVSQVSKVEPISRWIKHNTNNLVFTFNPSRSIFASKAAYNSPISPPGSPPEPVYRWADDDGEDAPELTFPEAIDWEMLGFPVEDMMTEASSIGASDHGSRTTRLSAKQRLNSPDRAPTTISEMRRVKSPDRKGSHAVSPSKPRNASLEEKLSSFLMLEPIALPFRYEKPAHLDYAGSLCWQQLLACWKHSEMARALTTQQPSRHFDRLQSLDRTYYDCDLSSGSSRIRKPLIGNLRLNGIELNPPIRPETKNLDGFNPGDGLAITRFLDSLPSRGGRIRHDVEDLLEFADRTTTEFVKLMETVVAFARLESIDVDFEVNVKVAEAITKKARQKYGGDLLQVKDVLRSKIIFPTESSLVCGLIKLFQIEGENFKVLRIKNLFRRDESDDLVDSPLPTKYRHILVNIRWHSGFLSEIQFNLERMYDIMQDEGCKLHQRLLDLKNAWNGFPPLLNELTISVLSQAPAGHVQSFLTGASLSPCPSETKKILPSDHSLHHFQAPDLDDCCANAEFECESTRHDISDREHLEELRKTTFPDGDIFLAILERASLDTFREPRDLPVHYCCYLILRSILHNANDTDNLHFLGYGIKTRADMAAYAKRCLMRSLTISNQALSVGMYGWLEYGTKSSLVRLLGQPFDLLRLLAYDYALLGQWNNADRVLKEQLLRCEQNLPRYHPTTLICMIDLAVVSQTTGKTRFASRLVSQAAMRLTDYLAEMEKGFLQNLSKSTKVGGKLGDTVVRIEHGRDCLSMLQSFVSMMRQEMKREMVDIVLLAESNEAILANHCFLGEALCILANCKAAARALSGCRKELRETYDDPLWTEAASHFHHSLSGFLIHHDRMTSMVVARSAFGLARCLRESNESEKALEILSIVTSRHSHSGQAATVRGRSPSMSHPSKRFLHTPKDENTILVKQIISALCLWLMAALALDRSSDEDGRGLAFRYLHAASVSLQSALKQTSEDDPLRSSYIQFLSLIEDEALQIAEPIYE